MGHQHRRHPLHRPYPVAPSPWPPSTAGSAAAITMALQVAAQAMLQAQPARRTLDRDWRSVSLGRSPN